MTIIINYSIIIYLPYISNIYIFIYYNIYIYSVATSQNYSTSILPELFLFAQFEVLSLNNSRSLIDIVFDANKELWILNIRVASSGASFLTPFERKYDWHTLQLRPWCKGHDYSTPSQVQSENICSFGRTSEKVYLKKVNNQIFTIYVWNHVCVMKLTCVLYE